MPAVVAGHSLGEYTALVARGRARLRRRVAAGALPRAGDAGSGARRRGRDGGDPRSRRCGGRRRLPRGGAGTSQVVEPVNFNGPEQIVIAGHKEAVERAIDLATERGREARRAAAGVRAVPQLAPEAGGGAARGAGSPASTLQPPSIPVLHNVDVAERRDAGRDPHGARAAGGEPGALGRDDRGVRRARRDACRRMRARAGC